MFFLSELVGPWQDVEGTGCGGDRDVAAEKEVLLLRPECGLQRPCPAQPALCTGTQSTDIDLVNLSEACQLVRISFIFSWKDCAIFPGFIGFLKIGMN